MEAYTREREKALWGDVSFSNGSWATDAMSPSLGMSPLSSPMHSRSSTPLHLNGSFSPSSPNKWGGGGSALIGSDVLDWGRAGGLAHYNQHQLSLLPSGEIQSVTEPGLSENEGSLLRPTSSARPPLSPPRASGQSDSTVTGTEAARSAVTSGRSNRGRALSTLDESNDAMDAASAEFSQSQRISPPAPLPLSSQQYGTVANARLSDLAPTVSESDITAANALHSKGFALRKQGCINYLERACKIMYIKIISV